VVNQKIMSDQQPELGLFESAPPSEQLGQVLEILDGRGWMLAADLLRAMGITVSESNKRKLREIANQSEGQIASGQDGYKLVRDMTADEYNHFRNWMKRQADQMTARILRSDKVFYQRGAVRTGNGILETKEN
jgi:hypothetical protein